MIEFLYLLTTIVFVVVVSVLLTFNPKFDKTAEGDVLLWYNLPFRKERRYFVVYTKN